MSRDGAGERVEKVDGHTPEPRAAAPDSSASVSGGDATWLLHLQRSAGNAAVASSLALAQAKLEVGPAGDVFEREADAVAASVVEQLGRRRPGPIASNEGAGPAAAQFQRRAAPSSRGEPVDSQTERDVESARTGGQALSADSRRDMEGAFGSDFSAVRLHAGNEANDLNQRLQAKAFTIGTDIFFRDALPDQSPAGQELLAHELTHTIQQTGRADRTIQRFPGSGYYVVCSPDAPGALLIEKDNADPKRYYRTVAKLSAKAKKADKQPFSLWSLYDDPEVETLPALVEDERLEEEDDISEPEHEEDDGEAEVDDAVVAPAKGEDAPKASGRKSNRKRKKNKNKNKNKAPAVATVTPEPTAPVTAPKVEKAPEPAWKAKYRETAKGKLKSGVEENINYLEKEVRQRATKLEKAVAELATVWIPELEAGLEKATLAERTEALRTGMPVWDGHYETYVAKIGFMDAHVRRAESEVADVKVIAALKAKITDAGLTKMLAAFSPEDVVEYAKVVGDVRLHELLITRDLDGGALKHYGAKMMKTFVGAGAAAWTHVITASLNSQGVISGGHDAAVFMAFLNAEGYALDGVPVVAPVYKVKYKNDVGVVKGTKTLIQNLKTTKATWLPKFNEAIWGAIKAKTFRDGEYTGADAAGQRYGGYYTKGKNEVDTVYPTL